MLRMTVLLGAGVVTGVIIGYAIFGLESPAMTDSDTQSILYAIATSVVKEPTPTATATVYADSLPLCDDAGVVKDDVCVQVLGPDSYVEVCSDLHWARRRELAMPCKKAGYE